MRHQLLNRKGFLGFLEAAGHKQSLVIWPILHFCMFLWLSSDYFLLFVDIFANKAPVFRKFCVTFISVYHGFAFVQFCSYVVLKSCHLTSLRRTGPLWPLASIGSSLTFAMFEPLEVIYSDKDQLLQSSEGILLNVFFIRFIGPWWFAMWVCNLSLVRWWVKKNRSKDASTSWCRRSFKVSMKVQSQI